MNGICPIRFDDPDFMYREIKSLYRHGDNLYKVYYSVATMEWVFGNGKRIRECDLEDYFKKNFQFIYIEDAFDWFDTYAKSQHKATGDRG